MRSEFKDYYLVLDVSKNATLDEINMAFRRLSRKYHPDISADEMAEEKYQEITEAYEVLSDDKKRREYDLNYDYLKSKKDSKEDYTSKNDSGKNYTDEDIRRLRIIKIKEQVLEALKKAHKLLDEIKKLKVHQILKKIHKEIGEFMNYLDDDIDFLKKESDFYKKRLKLCKNKIIGFGIFGLISDGIMALVMINDIDSNYMGLAISGFEVVSAGVIVLVLNELMKYLKNSYDYEDTLEKIRKFSEM